MDAISHPRFSPSLDYVSYFSQNTVLGNFQLSKEIVIAITETSAIHNLTDSNWIIKYQMDCLEELTAIHPLLADYWFVEHVAPFGLAPKPVVLSDPVPLRARKTLKTDFHIRSSLYRACAHLGSSVRYAIMERERENLHDYMLSQPGEKLPFVKAIQLGLDLINLVKRLHDNAQIVHGDIHSGNVCFSSKNPSKLVLIDFARAKFLDDTVSQERIREPNVWNDALLSPWEIMGFEPARRDDVMRVLLLVATLMNGFSFYNYLSSFNSDVGTSLDIKVHRNLFLADPAINPLEELGISRSDRSEIVEHLESVLEAARSVRFRADRPNYELIEENFKNAIKIITKI